MSDGLDLMRKAAQLMKEFNLTKLKWNGCDELELERDVTIDMAEKAAKAYEEQTKELDKGISDEDILLNPYAGLGGK